MPSNEGTPEKEPQLSTHEIIMGILIIGCGVWMIISAAGSAFNGRTISGEEKTLQVNTSIVSLSDGSGSRGSFFLGSGSLSERLYFVYYEGETTFRLKKVPADLTSIIMDEETSPYLSTISYVTEYTQADGKKFTKKDRWMLDEYVFHVPDGTIVKQYALTGGI